MMTSIPLKVSSLTDIHYSQYINLSKQAFGVSSIGEKNLLHNYSKYYDILVGSIDNRIVSQILIHKAGIWINGNLLSLGGFAGMTTSKQHRKKGYATVLIRKAIEHLHTSNKYSMAALYPTTYTLYNNCGFVIGDKGFVYKGKGSSFKPLNWTSNFNAEIRIVNADDIPMLQRIRHKFASLNNGLIERSILVWHSRIMGFLYENNPIRWVAIHYDITNEPDGYLLYKVSNSGKPEICELIYTSQEALNWLLHFISEKFAKWNISLNLNVDIPLLSLIANPLKININSNPQDFAMYRVINVAAVLRKKRISKNNDVGKLIMHVTDPIGPWNEGNWLITINYDNIECERVSNEIKADVMIDIKLITQLFIGYLTLSQVVENKFLSVEKKQSLVLLEKVFESTQSPFSCDQF